MSDMLEGKTWKDDLGEWEHLRFDIEIANQEDGIQELPDDEIRRIIFGRLENGDGKTS